MQIYALDKCVHGHIILVFHCLHDICILLIYSRIKTKFTILWWVRRTDGCSKMVSLFETLHTVCIVKGVNRVILLYYFYILDNVQWWCWFYLNHFQKRRKWLSLNKLQNIFSRFLFERPKINNKINIYGNH